MRFCCLPWSSYPSWYQHSIGGLLLGCSRTETPRCWGQLLDKLMEQDGLTQPALPCCPWAPTIPNHHGTWTATSTAFHFQNHTKIKENSEIPTRLVTIFHPPFRFLEYIKHVGFNPTLYTYLQVCRCFGTQSRVLTKASQREREVHYKQQQGYTTLNESQMISSLEVLMYSKTQPCYF